MSSLWHKTAEMPHFPPLQKDTETDVLIISGGMAGLLTAHFLNQNGVPYLLVEKGRLCGGNTGNTTAKLTVQHGLIYHRIMEKKGLEAAKGYLQANRMALRNLIGLCNHAECELEQKDHYVYSIKDHRRPEAEMAALQRLGADAVLARNTPLPFSVAGAVCFRDQAQFHPLKFAAAIAKGLHIYENTGVSKITDTTAYTPKGCIHAKRVVVASHFPFINKSGGYFMKMYQHRSYVLALENAPNLHGMYVDDEERGLSFRNSGRYLLLGGGGHRTGEKGGNWKELRHFAATFYPQAQERFYWAAQDCITLDGLPYIGSYAKRTPEVYVATGFNKWGMTGSMLSALLLTDRMLGRKNEYAPLFDPARSMVKSRLFLNGFSTAKNMLSFSSKRCPHLGCALKWNKAERSWDCPCHGSRISREGEILDNPANK